MSKKQINGWDLEELRPVKDWSIKDFTPYRIESQHFLSQVAFLCHEVDPAFDQLGNTWWIHPFLRDRCTALYFRKIGTNEVHYYTEIADPVKNGNNTAPDWKGIPPGERHSKPRVQREDMEPYLGPLGPIDESKKLKIYHAEKIEMEYHEIWGEIKKTYNYLLIGAKEGTLPVRNSTGYETDFSATRDDLRKFFTERLKKRPKFLFPEERETSGQPDFIPGPGFRSVIWQGREYSFTSRQAQIIEVLYDAFKEGTPDVSKDKILEDLESPSNRLKDAFQNSPAWKTLIVQGKTRGTYRLNL